MVFVNAVSRPGDKPIALRGFQIRRHHLRDDFAERDFGLPPQLGPRLACVPQERLHLRRTKIARIDGHDAPSAGIEGFLVETAATPAEFHPYLLSSGIHKVAYSALLSC